MVIEKETSHYGGSKFKKNVSNWKILWTLNLFLVITGRHGLVGSFIMYYSHSAKGERFESLPFLSLLTCLNLTICSWEQYLQMSDWSEDKTGFYGLLNLFQNMIYTLNYSENNVIIVWAHMKYYSDNVMKCLY